jgi:hypothetical protein
VPRLLGAWGAVVSAGVTTKVPVKCPQCYRVVTLTAEEFIDEDGEKYVMAEPIHHAMSLHMRVGCAGGRSTA